MTNPETASSSTKLSFAFLNLREELFKNLASLGYDTMTPIQAQSLPHHAQ